MQLVENKLYIANVAPLGIAQRQHAPGRRGVSSPVRAQHRCTSPCYRNLISALRGTSASERLLALMVTAFCLAATPAMLATIRSTVSLSLQILLQAGHFGLIAFQNFGR